MKTMSVIVAAGLGLAVGGSVALSAAHAAPAGDQVSEHARSVSQTSDEKLKSFWTKQECVDAGKLGKDNDDWTSFKCRESEDAAGNELWVLSVTREEPKPDPKPEPKPEPEPNKPNKPGKVKNPLDMCTWAPWLCED